MANSGDPLRIMTAIFIQWLREDTDCSWKKLIGCMKKCDLTHFAQEMEIALGLAVQGNSRLHVREDHFNIQLYMKPVYEINDISPVYNIRLVLLIYLGWELLCVAYITVLHVCVKAISILSASFLCQPYCVI